MTKFEVLDTGAQKDTQNKLRFDLIPPEIDKALAEVLTLGAISKGYGPRNWEKGIPFMTSLGAMKRHLNEWELGHDINTKDGDFHHLKHALTNLAFIVTMIERGREDLDDRPTNRKSS
jgi:hypothetical protein